MRRSPVLKRRPGFLIRRLHQIHLALFAEECARHEVTAVQYSIMTVAGENPGIDQAALAYEVGVDHATLATVMRRLESKALLRRRVSRKDRRMKSIRLTAKGTAVLVRMRAAAARAHSRTVAALPPGERRRFVALLWRLVDAGNDYGRAPLRLG